MIRTDATVFLVDDEESVLRATSRLLRSAGLRVQSFRTAEEFLGGYDAGSRGCVVLDIGMPGLSGLDLQSALVGRGCELPIVFLTGRADVPMSVRAMKQGAVDLLTKPVDDSDLLRVVRAAVEKDRANWQARVRRAEVRRRLETLTPREREVLEQVVAGKLNKETAAELGTTEKTIKVHRGRIMQKMSVTSVAALVRLVERDGTLCRAEGD
jgi:FixJ family two-component response regulator